MSSEGGVALLMALWVMSLLGVMAFAFSVASRQEAMGARNLKEEAQAYALALSKFHEVLYWLATDPDPQVDYVDEEGNLRTDPDRPPMAGQGTQQGAHVVVKVVDMESRLNLNVLKARELQALLGQAGVPEEDLQALADAILDWTDPDDEHHLLGVESDYYESLSPPYKAKNAPLDTLGELVLVKDFQKEYLEAISPYATVQNAGINVNTATKETLAFLGIDPLEVGRIVGLREDLGGLRAIPASATKRGVNLTASFHFKVDVFVRPKGSRQGVHIEALLQRQHDPRGFFVLRTLYWRDSLEVAYDRA